MTLTSRQKKLVHQILHGKKPDGTAYRGLKIGNAMYFVSTTREGLRKVEFADETYQVQNPNKEDSYYAVRAKAGDCITWVMRDGIWGRIEGDPSSLESIVIEKP